MLDFGVTHISLQCGQHGFFVCLSWGFVIVVIVVVALRWTSTYVMLRW